MITFADVPTLLQDPDGALDDFLRRYLPVAVHDVYAPTPPQWGAVGISGSGSIDYAFPAPNWPPPPGPLQFNTLYWPTGATRWAHCFLLADRERREQIWDAVNLRDTTHQAADLVMKDEDRDITITASMWLLPPRRIPIDHKGVIDELWIMPLVDQRYYWQFRNAPSGYAPADWGDAFTDILDDLGATYDSIAGFDSGYDSPAVDSLEFINAAVMLDALAFTVGRRVVTKLDGTVLVQSTVQAETQLDRNREPPYRKVSGGDVHDIRAAVPEFLTLKFPDEAVTELATDYDHTTYTTDARHVVHVPNRASDDTTALRAAYAAAYAADWFAWRKQHYDAAYASLHHWTPTGFDDCVVWEFGRLDGDYRATTRVRTLPANYTPATLLSMGSSASAGGADSGCDCDTDLIQGVTLTGSPNICCEGHEQLTGNFGPLIGDRNLWHQGGDIWSTFSEDPTEDNPYEHDCGYGYSADLYDLVLDLSESPPRVRLEFREVYGSGYAGYGECDPICANWWFSGAVYPDMYQCEASNLFKLGKFTGVDPVDGVFPLSRCVCLSPAASTIETQECTGPCPGSLVPDAWTLPSFSLSPGSVCAQSGCDSFSAGHTLAWQGVDASSGLGDCRWGVQGLGGACSGDVPWIGVAMDSNGDMSLYFGTFSSFFGFCSDASYTGAVNTSDCLAPVIMTNQGSGTQCCSGWPDTIELVPVGFEVVATDSGHCTPCA